MGELIERAIAEQLLAAVAPDQITLALTAADAVADRARRTAVGGERPDELEVMPLS